MNLTKKSPATKFATCLISLLFILSAVCFNQAVFASNPAQDSTWQAHPLHVSPYPSSGTPASSAYTPAQMKTAYNLPMNGGAGSIIAIIIAYHTENLESIYNTFCSQYGLPDNTTGNLIVKSYTNTFDAGWALETCLDVEWAHAIAPQAKVLLVEAASTSNVDLLAAVDYATSYPGVVAVSMSWGGPEFVWENTMDNHFNKQGITFFAASGDDGKNVLWPAASASVVSVGGTTLKLNSDGTVISETTWQNSSGGLSKYVLAPSYQTAFGLGFSHRAVPDVSYDGNASTGVSVYDGTWHLVGGTSAGAPQWAAIHALGLSASHEDLYRSAKTVSPLPFRDITSGSNGYDAGRGYDYVTGLGSTQTSNFGFRLDVSPNQGPPQGDININGEGFTAGSSVDLEYLNPLTAAWTPLLSGLSNPSGSFSYATAAFDLQQSSPSGDNPAIHEDILYRAVDNAEESTVPTLTAYMERRRGLTQIDSAFASGVFGDNTDLSGAVTVQNSQSVALAGVWFSPGTATLTWDGTDNLGTAAISSTGAFTASFNVPAETPEGIHTVTVDDGGASLTFSISSRKDPIVLNPVPEGPEVAVFTVTLAAIALAFYVKRK